MKAVESCSCKGYESYKNLTPEVELPILLIYFRQPLNVLGSPLIVTFPNSHKFGMACYAIGVEAPITNDLRIFAPYLEKYKLVGMFPV
jgi:hypothetical protein